MAKHLFTNQSERDMSDILHIKARHFKDADFESNINCAVAIAAKEQFNINEVNTSYNYLIIRNTIFYKIQYDYAQFKEDLLIAKAKGFSDEVIREIRLL